MKRVAAALALQVFVLSATAAEAPKGCTLCVGAVVQTETSVPAEIPVLATQAMTTAPAPAAPDAYRRWTMLVDIDITPDGGDAVTQVESKTQAAVEWAAQRAPMAGFGASFSVSDPSILGYAVKRLAVQAQGSKIAPVIVLRPASLDQLAQIYETGAQAYFDAVVVDGEKVAETAKWLAERDPAKKIYAIVTPLSPNTAFDLAKALADGATTAFLGTVASPGDFTALANFDRALAGDYAYDSTARITVLDAKGAAVEMPVLTFVRGEDLRTIVVPRGDAAAASIISLPNDRFTRPRIVDAAGDRTLADVGSKGGRFLIGVQPVRRPILLTVDHAEKPDANITKEAISVSTERGITVEEIIRNHQSYKSFEDSIQPRYVARDATKLRFAIGDGGEAIEATIAGDYFSDPAGRADWVWHDFYINGVKWKYGKIPELPLIQPEKVTQLPLDLHLTNDYRYQLVRQTELDGYQTYEVRFEPPPNAPETLPLYRGTVWIDAHTWARVRISMIQLHLTGEVLSNEERVDYQPFARTTSAPMTAIEVAQSDPQSILWLPREVSAQQVISAAGRANVVLRSTEFSNFRINPPDFESLLAAESASDARMVRETEKGLKYLEKTSTGERVVKEGFDTARLFLLGGVHHDEGLEYPVIPLGGVDYFNFDVKKTGVQANVFFAGVVVAANATHPNVGDTHTNVGADLFAIALPTTSSMYRNGVEVPSEAVRLRPFSLSLRAGHPVFQFGKIDLSLGLLHLSYSRADDTAKSFGVPSNTFVISPEISAEYSRWGYSASAFYSYSSRSKWRPWGNLAEYDPNQKTFTNYGGGFGKSFYLPKFQRIGVQLNYLGGQRLDRFSGYELGFFGTTRVHGVRSGSIHADHMVLGHLSYGFVVSDQFRLEAFYDHALVDDKIAGYRREPFQGLGFGGQTVGPWGTLLRLDVGKTVGRNAQNGFVADVVVLKLF